VKHKSTARALPGGRAGLTLVETLVVVTLSAMLVGGISAILAHCFSGWSNGASAATAETQGDLALQRLLSEICDGKNASLSGGVLTVTFPLLRTDPGTGEAFYDRNADGEVRQYYLDGGALKRQVAGSVSIAARGISAASFSVTADTVGVTLSATECLGSEPVCRQVSGRVVLRNRRSAY